MAWLVANGVRVELEIASTRAARARGLLGRDRLDGVLLLPSTRSVHTLGMRFAIDVAHVDADGCVISTTSMRPNRLGRVVRRADAVLEATEGSFDRWGIGPGVVCRIEGLGDEVAA